MIRVRIAPSPTGFLHIGNAQSALYNWLFAQKNGGSFLLRIEDTDKERSTKEFENNIYDSLEWLDLKPDEPPVIQSANLPRHREMLDKLLTEAKAFYCHHSKDQLEQERSIQEERKLAPIHICSHKNEPIGKKVGGIIRLAVSQNETRMVSWTDLIRGPITFLSKLLGDFAIARAIDDPLYHFAVVVDDADMGITNVLRGEDHISNTPKQILLYEALEFSSPQFGHLPLILAPDRTKLSKRHGNVGTLPYSVDYLPEAMLNFLGSLSYTFSKEIISKEEMAKEFEVEKVHKSGAVFDIKKLNWINSQWVKKLSPQELKKKVANFKIPDLAVPLITERLEKLSDIKDFKYFWREPEYDKNLLAWKKSTLEKSIETLAEVRKLIEGFYFEKGGSTSSPQRKDELRKVLDDFSLKVGDRGLVYWPLRVAITGQEKSPDPIDIIFVIGKEKTLERINNAINKSE